MNVLFFAGMKQGPKFFQIFHLFSHPIAGGTAISEILSVSKVTDWSDPALS
jgi:hypothetical protein